jgi:hypothetical protein
VTSTVVEPDFSRRPLSSWSNNSPTPRGLYLPPVSGCFSTVSDNVPPYGRHSTLRPFGPALIGTLGLTPFACQHASSLRLSLVGTAHRALSAYRLRVAFYLVFTAPARIMTAVLRATTK